MFYRSGVVSPIAPVIVTSVLLVAALRELIYPSGHWLTLWNVLILLFLIAALLLVLNGLLLPLIQLVTQLQ